MLHAKFQYHRALVLWKKHLRGFAIYGHDGHLGHLTWPIYINFRPPFPRLLHIKFSFDCQVVSEKKIFENGRRRTTERRRTDDRRMPARWVYYKLTL